MSEFVKKRFGGKIFSPTKGQATLELALIVPILMGLLYWAIQAYRVNRDQSQASTKAHVEAIEKFDYGNGTITIDGIEVPAGSFIEIIPSAGGFSLGNLLPGLVPGLGLDLGLNRLFDRFNFLNGSTYVSGALRGGLYSAANSFVESGFKKVDWESAAWAAGAGAFSSEQATQDFQGDFYQSASFRESTGSTLQHGVVGFAASEGDLQGAADAAAGGLMHSDTSREFFESGNEILKGAARGALESSLVGVASGKFELKDAAMGTGFGVLNTRSFAQTLPLTHWSGDPRDSASFGALNAALGTLVNKGNTEDAFYAATAGAFFSGQNMNKVAGQSSFRAALAGAGYGASVSLLKGQNATAVGLGALESMAGVLVVHRDKKLQQVFDQVIQRATTQEDIAKILGNDEFQEMIVNTYIPDLDESLSIVEEVLPSALEMADFYSIGGNS